MSSLGDSAAPPATAVQRSPWHSPVPYLFGGLAAMLGLIAFALLILACSYWKLSGYLENRGEGERDLEAGETDGAGEGGATKTPPPVMEEKFLVIMAGQEKPTFLATPMTSRASSFGSKSTCSTSSSDSSTLSEDCEGKKIENSGLIEMGNLEAHETSPPDQVH